ncbi:hypothetical protein [Persephonella sp.]
MRVILFFLIIVSIVRAETIVLDAPQKSSDRFTAIYNTLLKDLKNGLNSIQKKEKELKDIDAVSREYQALLKKVSVQKILVISRYKEYEEATITALKDIGVSQDNIKKIYTLFEEAKKSLVRSLDKLEEFLLYKKKKFDLLKNFSFKVENGKIIFSDKKAYQAYKDITGKIKKAFEEYRKYSEKFIKINKQIVKKVNEFAG